MEQNTTKTDRRKEFNLTPRRCFEIQKYTPKITQKVTPRRCFEYKKTTPRRSIYCSLKYIIINLNLKVRYIFNKIFLLTYVRKKIFI